MLYVEPHLIQCALGAEAKSLPFVRSAASADIRLASALRHALDEWTRQWEALEADQIILGIANALLALDATAQRASAPTICARAVERARQFLDENHDRTVASEELESLTGLDRFTLARHFRARLGTSPYRYLTMRRLDCTRHCIRDGYTLAEAATVKGFADQSHMTRQFKQAYGISPGRWQALTRQ
jgi:AraC-like DNA-binding protein